MNNDRIPEQMLASVAGGLQKLFNKCVENFNDYEQQRLQKECGPAYAHIPACDIRAQAANLRKRNLVEPIKGGHGPVARKPPSEEYQLYSSLRDPRGIQSANPMATGQSRHSA